MPSRSNSRLPSQLPDDPPYVLTQQGSNSPETHTLPSHRSRPPHSYNRPSCQQETCEHGLLSPHISRANSYFSIPTSGSRNPSGHKSSHLSHEVRIRDEEEQHNSSSKGAFDEGEAGGTYPGHDLLRNVVAEGPLGAGAGDVRRRRTMYVNTSEC